MVQLSQVCVTTGKTIALTIWTFVSRVMSAFQHIIYICHSFPAEKQMSSDFMAAVTIHSDFRAQEEEICHYFNLSPLYLLWSIGAGCHDLSCFFFVCLFVCWYLVLSWLFYLPPSSSSRGFLVLFGFLPLEWYHEHIWACLCFSHLSWLQLVIPPVQHFSWCAQCID